MSLFKLISKNKKKTEYKKISVIKSVAAEDVACVNLVGHIIERGIVTVGYDRARHLFEAVEIVAHERSEERGAIGQSRLLDYDLRSFGLDTLHHTLNGRLAEIIGVGFHH